MIPRMGKLTIALLLLALTACGSSGGSSSGDDDDDSPARCGDGNVDSNEQCDDGNTVAGDGCTLCMLDQQRTAKVDASWQVTTVADVGGMTADCPAGFDTAALTSTPASGAPTIDLFDCADAMGMSSALPPAVYSATIAITNHAMSATFATSLPQIVDLSDATDKPLDAAFLTDGGVFTYKWRLQKNGADISCDDIGVSPHIKLVGKLNDGVGTQSGAVCSDGMAVTSPFVAGTYTVTVSVQDDAFHTVGSAPDLTNQVLTAPNGVLDLGTVTIVVNTM